MVPFFLAMRWVIDPEKFAGKYDVDERPLDDTATNFIVHNPLKVADVVSVSDPYS